MTVETNVVKIFAMASPIEIKLNTEAVKKIAAQTQVYIDAKTPHKAAVELAGHLIKSSAKISRKRLGEIATEQFQKLEAGEPKQ